MSKYAINILDVIERKRSGETNRLIAEAYGIPEHAIENALRRTGNTGMGRGKQRDYNRTARVGRRNIVDLCLDVCDEIVLERGLNGGYVATVGSKTGRECWGIAEAMRDAYQGASVGGISE